MTQPLVVFAVATYTGAACHEFQQSFVETLSVLAQRGIPSGTLTVSGDPYLSKARNRLATDFLVNWGSATHIFFLDDDIGWPGAKVADFIERDLDVIGGVYPKKSDNSEWPLQLDTVDGMPVETGGLYRSLLAPTGFLCVKRRVMEKMAAASEQYLDTTNAANPDRHFNIFDMGWFQPDGTRPTGRPGAMGEFWGEDYYFCRRWRDMGGEVWIDPDIMFSHRGPKAWRGALKPALDLWVEQEKKKREPMSVDQAAD